MRPVAIRCCLPVQRKKIINQIDNLKLHQLVKTLFEENIEKLKQMLKGKTTSIAGPSGVGKSSTLNSLFPDANVQTGGLSEKIQRGKHTTRHSELMFVDDDTYIMDTPGFSSLYTEGIEAEDLKLYFPEIAAYTGTCKFNMCNHISEPGCLVKEAVGDGRISKMRYDDYVMIYNELKEKRKW